MTPAIDLLKKAKAEHRVHSYQHDPKAPSDGLEAAEKLGLDPARVFKTLLAATEKGELLVAVPKMGEAETQLAIDAAERAFVQWKAKTADQRAAVLHKWFELLMANQEDLAQIMTAEQGKPLAESRGEIAYAASYVQWFAEEARRIYGSTVPAPWAAASMVTGRCLRSLARSGVVTTMATPPSVS